MVQAVGVQATQAVVLAASAFPSDGLRATQANVLAAADSNGDTIRTTQALVLVATLGRTNNPNVRSWTYTLDEHTHYVIRLGALSTLELDLKTGMWSVWGTGNSPLWRAYTGINWQGAGPLRALGSNVVVGDDGNGALYILDPDGEADDHPLQGAELPQAFIRKVTGQVAFRGRGTISCAGVELLGSVGQQTSGALGGVTLYTSDDRGETYQDRGTITVSVGELDRRLDWRQLGGMKAPGRLFRIEDEGALKRIDSLSMKP